MSPRKLTNDNKKEILKLYRETGETTSTLAERYEVSSSTISRFLKTHLTESEYEDLIQQKRLARTPKGALQLELEKMSKSEALEEAIAPIDEQKTQLPLEIEEIEPKSTEEPTVEIEKRIKPVRKEISFPSLDKEEIPQKIPVQKKITIPSSKAETLHDEEEEEEEDIDRVDAAAFAMLDEEDFDEDEDELEEDEEDWEDEVEISYPKTFSKTTHLQILPISSAAFPKICYLVIDRSAELITRPLKEFAELGKIPAEEVQQKTLPVFDNHRVARRFSKRRERVIKVPDGRMIQKTRSYLEAKGITRLLLDGQIYSI